MNFDLEHGPHGQAYKLLVGLVAPRPIALITSMDEDGLLNAAPFSAYNYLCTDPPIVGVGVTNRSGQQFVPKDTARNIRRTGEFVVNVVTEDIAEKMNICATDFPPEMSEVELAGFTTAPSQVVKPPRLAEAHAALECRQVRGSGRALYQGRRAAFYRPHERAGKLRAHARRIHDDSAHFV
jgi:flavin reductase (DIM6/NTAB) family NADH-FMN oxidoreductase RutF